MNIKPEYYTQLDNELRTAYQIEFGINPLDISLVEVTKEEQIERIARNLYFWEKHMPRSSGACPKTSDNAKDMAKLFMCQNGCLKMLEKAEDCGILQEVMYRIKELRQEKSIELEIKNPKGFSICKSCKKSNIQLYSCTRCRSAKYCCRECQKVDWKIHKLSCI